jgi:transcriptional regulator with XRE-family HTH domain
MSSGETTKTFSYLTSIALARRLAPYTGLSRKQLCHDLQISTGTLDNWLGGRNEPGGGKLMELIPYFDPSFASEISGGIVTKIPSKQAAEALQRMNEAHAALRAALGGG